MTEQINSLVEPSDRLIEGMLTSLRNVRESPALASWFATTQRPIGGEMAEQSEVIKAFTEAFVISLGPDDPEVDRAPRPLAGAGDHVAAGVPRAHDEADERAMLEEFVVPIVVPATQEML